MSGNQTWTFDNGHGTEISTSTPADAAQMRSYGWEEIATPDDDPTRADADELVPAVESAPPKTGAGSGVDAWAAYAATKGVATEHGATRADVIAALEAAGVATE